MNIIRDKEMGGLAMIPLFCDWHVKRCNVKDCTDVPTTIITGSHPKLPVIGMCEKHFQAANQPDGGQTYSFITDDFDAFKYKEDERAKEPK